MELKNPEFPALRNPSLFISDLHLSDADPNGIRWFATFTKWLDRSVCEELFILGDLFDFWVGPKQMRLAGFRPVIDSLKNLTQRGIVVTVLRGNRDVFLESEFAKESGVVIGEDCLVRDMGGERVLLMHGDLLCTRDLSYQRFRKFLHSSSMTWLGPRLPLSLALRLAKGFRRYSQRAVPQKLPEEKSIVDTTVKQYLEQFEAKTLICGHVHDRQERELEWNSQKRKLIVLPAFEMSEAPLLYRGEFRFAQIETTR